ncbi:hypothetical protein [Enterococcus gilvus]|uniref:hypothetical protein n=1 Tax=Enterococcus gilvus TaxID=160453 RepID=UPI0021AB4019|nr:hypothetical protein [Enterococcus gilvus]
MNDVNQENTHVLQTYDDQMESCETYIYGNERLSYTNHQTKEEYEYLTDARGSVTGLNKDGEMENTNSYGVSEEQKKWMTLEIHMGILEKRRMSQDIII